MSQICRCCLKCVNVVSNIWKLSQVCGYCLRSNGCCLKSNRFFFNIEWMLSQINGYYCSIKQIYQLGIIRLVHWRYLTDSKEKKRPRWESMNTVRQFICACESKFYRVHEAGRDTVHYHSTFYSSTKCSREGNCIDKI